MWGGNIYVGVLNTLNPKPIYTELLWERKYPD